MDRRTFLGSALAGGAAVPLLGAPGARSRMALPQDELRTEPSRADGRYVFPRGDQFLSPVGKMTAGQRWTRPVTPGAVGVVDRASGDQ
ncbi:hypothetical protein [Actinacidiphila bryophytorum]|uniref:Uncharacterized protein n=1 Tax=Actinacidiphila bryophytorum TaxID=1436133 RepID=A0A9W4H2J9_9ACTN|nr:hypothetical protein [Actinacidiphila bryophytorum]MBM9437010.1 hypothetical protein [Actinacidiphila bryophytorum]MBN6544718.1 hypothetical protein [Actinacidiphila bryophytorum]CAG7646210.1 hypothetical protein SBRY_40357 [Actinacidiphila bryophytorum]